MARPCLPALVAALVVASPIAWTHDSWISQEQYRDPVSGDWCCDDHDCAPIGDDEVARTASGFMIAGKYPVDYRRALPSGDDRYWVCFNEEGKGPHDRMRNVKCLFVPLNA